MKCGIDIIYINIICVRVGDREHISHIKILPLYKILFDESLGHHFIFGHVSRGIDSKWKMKKETDRQTNGIYMQTNKNVCSHRHTTAIKTKKTQNETEWERKKNDLNTMDILLRKFIVAQYPTIHYGDTWMQGTFISF